MFIDETVAKILVNRAASDVAKVFGQDVGEELPVAEMAQDEHNRTARPQ